MIGDKKTIKDKWETFLINCKFNKENEIITNFGLKDKPLLDNFQPKRKTQIYSSSVEIFPGSCPSALALSTRLIIFPLRVLGSESTNSICCGFAIGPTS